MTRKTTADYTSANKAAWEASAHLHEQGAAWDALLDRAARPGFSVLDEHLTGMLRGLGLEGGSAVQIGCNNARELLSLASLGIQPTLGIDQSPAFLNQARRLAAASGSDATFLEADIYDLPAGLGPFGLALVTIGVINWMPDLPRFFRIVSGLLAKGGRLVIYDTHPFMELFDPGSATPHEPAFSYFDKHPQEVREAIAYDGKDHGAGETGYWFIHPLGGILTACAAAGLRLVALEELPYSIREPEYDLYQGRRAQIPMSYSLVAARER